ncbi:ATPase, T2SS/T4P/T4SS family [Jeongeupia sp. USM3]|uniref:ATPase, T2SS/T4P/T4SS family n=1 Tax=Jeongeupia sp. USM3 TaxID=1906741 RepID=UPI000B22A7F6|nr:ATPase, T2SS/T4P/T4SS family [Jeongeupia sp. USM3]
MLATLHTNDAASAVTRLTDMGIEPFLLASSLLGVLAQRLARTLCPDCRTAYAADEAERSGGWRQCAPAGRRQAAATAALWCVRDAAGRRTRADPSSRQRTDHQAACAAAGMLTRQDGERLARDGRTSLEEVWRVTREH